MHISLHIRGTAEKKISDLMEVIFFSATVGKSKQH